MLIQPNSRALGDGLLSRAEALKRTYESTDRMLQKYRLPDHESLKDAEARMGSPMLHTELIRRVTKLNPAIWAEDSRANPTTVCGFYTRGAEGVRFLGAFEKGWLPEHSFILTDRADLATKEKRGWRTVLVRLLNEGVLTWPGVLRAFGDSHSSIRNERWRQQTQRFRTA